MADGEYGAEVYCAAGDRSQASLVYNTAKEMYEASPMLQGRLEVFKRTMFHHESLSKYEVLSADAPCLHPDTLLDLDSGKQIKAKDVKRGDSIIAWQNNRLIIAKVKHAEKQLPSMIYKIKTHRGREISVTSQHPFLTMMNGKRHQDLTHKYHWKKASEIKIGDRIGVALGWPGLEKKATKQEIEESWGLGAWVGDGECGRFRFINTNESIVNCMKKVIENIGSKLKSIYSTRQIQKGDYKYQGEHIIVGNGKRTKSHGREWIRKHLGQNVRARTKYIPSFIMTAGKECWCAFLAGWLDTDGCITTKEDDGVFWASMSNELLKGGQILLGRLGINASITKQNKLTVNGSEQLKQLYELLNPYIANKKKSDLFFRKTQRNCDKSFNAHIIDKVISIEKNGVGESISIEVEEVDTHITNGLITHNTKHGLNASGIIIDELHVQPNRDLVDVLTTSIGAREQPLTIMITTAGYDRNSVCWEYHEYARQVIEGTLVDDTFYGILFAADEKDNWEDEAVWAKANPSLDQTIGLDYLRTEYKRAKEIPAYQNTFRRLHLNQWTQQSVRFIDMVHWNESAGIVDEEELQGEACYGGLDLASTIDIAAFVLIFPDAEKTYRVLPFFWIPGDNVKEKVRRDKVPYDLWIKQGYIKTTPGNVIDYGFIRKDINTLKEQYNIQEIAYDPWNATQITLELAEGDGMTMIPVRQGFQSMSAPTKELLKLIVSKQLRHGNNSVLNWMADNMAVKNDPAGNIKPDKEKSTQRIDGIVALIMALDRAIRNVHAGSVYEERGLIAV